METIQHRTTEEQAILNKVDHTLLRVDATWDEMKKIIDEGIEFQTASVCIPPAFVKQGADYAKGKVKICTVIGFPNGYSTTKTKCFEASDAVENGADEIDMVISLGMVKEGNFDAILQEINEIKAACAGKLLKVIVETCLLTEEELIKLCQVVSESEADYIKTSTGFSTAGAKIKDIQIMKQHMDSTKGIKAAGGIADMNDAREFLKEGATRLGTSKVVAACKK